MPLTSLGVMPQYLEQVRKGATGPTPLDAIEARRASRAKEELDKYNSESDRLKALAAFQTAGTGASAESYKQQLDASTRAVLSAAPPVDAPEGSPEFVQQMRDKLRYMLNSGDEGASKIAIDLASKLTELQKTGGRETATQGGAWNEANIARALREGDLAGAQAQDLKDTRRESRAPNDAEVAMMISEITVEAKKGMEGASMLKRILESMSPTERLAKLSELKSMQDYIRNNLQPGERVPTISELYQASLANEIDVPAPAGIGNVKRGQGPSRRPAAPTEQADNLNLNPYLD